MGHGTEHRQNEAMQEAAERTWPGLSEGSPRPVKYDVLARKHADRLRREMTDHGCPHYMESVGEDVFCSSCVDREQIAMILDDYRRALLPSSEEG